MAEKRRTTERYISGNAAPVIRTVDSPERRNAEPKKNHAPGNSREEKKNRAPKRELKAGFGPVYTVVVVACMGFIMHNLVNYVQLNASITQKTKKIVSLQEELNSATIFNDNYETVINSSIDYAEMYRIATEELGMVYADKDQIKTYDRIESEYVEQYKDIE